MRAYSICFSCLTYFTGSLCYKQSNLWWYMPVALGTLVPKLQTIQQQVSEVFSALSMEIPLSCAQASSWAGDIYNGWSTLLGSPFSCSFPCRPTHHAPWPSLSCGDSLPYWLLCLPSEEAPVELAPKLNTTRMKTIRWSVMISNLLFSL